MISDHRFVALICRNDFNKIFDKKVVKSKKNAGHIEGPNVHIREPVKNVLADFVR